MKEKSRRFINGAGVNARIMRLKRFPFFRSRLEDSGEGCFEEDGSLGRRDKCGDDGNSIEKFSAKPEAVAKPPAV